MQRTTIQRAAAPLFAFLLAACGSETLRVPGEYPTIAAALAAAEEGDVVLLEPGEYQTAVQLKTGITLRGAGMDATLLWARSQTVLAATNVRGAEVEDLHIEAKYPADENGVAVWIADSQVTLRRCRVSGATLGGVEAQGAKTEVAVVESVLSGNAESGGHFQDGAVARLERNQVRDNGLSGIEVRGVGSLAILIDNVLAENRAAGAFFYQGASGRLERNLIAGNGTHGVWIKGTGTAPTLARNVVFENREIGVWFQGGASPVLRDNIIAGNGFIGIKAGGFQVTEEASHKQPAASHNLLWDHIRGDFENFEPDPSFVLADPQFVDADRWDFRLGPESPARGSASDGDDMGLYPRMAPPSVVAARQAFESAKGGGAGAKPVASPPRLVDKRLAVVVGVQVYRDAAIPDLKYSRRDAQEVAKVLALAGYEVRLLTDSAAHVEKLKDALVWLSETGPDDHAVFYFSGHGSDQPDLFAGDRGFLLPVNARKASVPSTALGLNALRNAVDASAARRFTVLIDTCFAAGGKSVSPPRTNAKSAELTGGLTFGTGKVSLYSSRDNEPSLEAEQYRHGYFTYHLLEAFKEGHRSADEVYAYVYEKVTADTRNAQHPRRDYEQAEGDVAIY